MLSYFGKHADGAPRAMVLVGVLSAALAGSGCGGSDSNSTGALGGAAGSGASGNDGGASAETGGAPSDGGASSSGGSDSGGSTGGGSGPGGGTTRGGAAGDTATSGGAATGGDTGAGAGGVITSGGATTGGVTAGGAMTGGANPGGAVGTAGSVATTGGTSPGGAGGLSAGGSAGGEPVNNGGSAGAGSVCQGVHPNVEGDNRFCDPGACLCVGSDACFPAATVVECCADQRIQCRPPGGDTCTGSHPNVEGDNRFCDPGACYCGANDTCFPTGQASGCCPTDPVCA